MPCNCRNSDECGNCDTPIVHVVVDAAEIGEVMKTVKLDLLDQVRTAAVSMMKEEGVCEIDSVWERAVGIVGTRIENGKN